MKVSLAELFYIPNSWSNIRAGQNYIDVQISNYPIATHKLQTIFANKYTVLEERNLQFLKSSSQFKSPSRLEHRLLKPWEPTKVSTEAFMRIERVVSMQIDGCTDLSKCDHTVLVFDSARKIGFTYYFDVDPTHYGLGKEKSYNNQKIKLHMQSAINEGKEVLGCISISPKHYNHFVDLAKEFNHQFHL